MPRGGARPGAGRPKGSRENWKHLIQRPVISGISPLDLLLAVVQCPEAPVAIRLAAAKEAAPYVHRKLAPLPAPKGTGDDVPPADDGWGDDLEPGRPN